MALYLRDLWGIAAILDVFNFGGGLFFIDAQSTMVHLPAFSFSKASARRHAVAVGSRADGCGPCLMASSHISGVQFGPQSAGHPCVA